MEEHEHTNHFVTATFACDLYKMKMLIALGKSRFSTSLVSFSLVTPSIWSFECVQSCVLLYGIHHICTFSTSSADLYKKCAKLNYIRTTLLLCFLFVLLVKAIDRCTSSITPRQYVRKKRSVFLVVPSYEHFHFIIIRNTCAQPL